MKTGFKIAALFLLAALVLVLFTGTDQKESEPEASIETFPETREKQVEQAPLPTASDRIPPDPSPTPVEWPNNEFMSLGLEKVAQQKGLDLNQAHWDPRNAALLDAILETYVEIQDLDSGIDFLKDLQQQQPLAEINQVLAKALIDAGRPEEAVSHIDETADFETAATVFLDLGLFDKAIAQYQLALSSIHDPGKIQDLTFKMAKAHFLNDELEKAQTLLDAKFGQENASRLWAQLAR